MASTIMHLTMYSPKQQCWHTIHRVSVLNSASRRLLFTKYTVPGPKTKIPMVLEARKNKSSMIADCQRHVYFCGSSSRVDGEIKQRQLVDGRGESSLLAHGDVFTNQQLESWLENMERLRKELNLTKDEFLKLVEDAPRLRNTEQLVHLLNAVAIMKDVGYSDLIVKYFVSSSPILLLNVTLESLNSVLKDQRDFLIKSEKYDHIFKPIRLLANGHIEERELFRMSMEPPFNKEKYLYVYIQKVLFPRKKLMVDNMPYQSFGEYVSLRLGEEQRVVDTILGLKSYNSMLNESLDIRTWTFVYKAVERISILLDLGASKQDILENHEFLTLDHRKVSLIHNISVVYNVVREQKHLFGKVDLKQTKKYFFPKETDSTCITLGRLFKTSLSRNYVPKKQRLYLEGKSQVNAVRVFHLLTDEGFTRQELRKFIYLFGVEESKIRSYLEARKGTGDKTSLKELEYAMKMVDNQVTKLF